MGWMTEPPSLSLKFIKPTLTLSSTSSVPVVTSWTISRRVFVIAGGLLNQFNQLPSNSVAEVALEPHAIRSSSLADQGFAWPLTA